MAAFPSGNPGIYPLEPLTDVGAFRLAYGDTESTAYDPVEPGFQNYDELSDAEIEVFLAQGGDSVNRAIGFYYVRLSGAAAKQSKSVKDYDLSVDLTKRASDLLKIAQFYFDQADIIDLGSEDAFLITSTGVQCDPWPPELAPWPLYPWRCGCGRTVCVCV